MDITGVIKYILKNPCLYPGSHQNSYIKSGFEHVKASGCCPKCRHNGTSSSNRLGRDKSDKRVCFKKYASGRLSTAVMAKRVSSQKCTCAKLSRFDRMKISWDAFLKVLPDNTDFFFKQLNIQDECHDYYASRLGAYRFRIKPKEEDKELTISSTLISEVASLCIIEREIVKDSLNSIFCALQDLQRHSKSFILNLDCGIFRLKSSHGQFKVIYKKKSPQIKSAKIAPAFKDIEPKSLGKRMIQGISKAKGNKRAFRTMDKVLYRGFY
ncbi:unnamed protein product [Moneuplotes crassus]|uniref:Uncharacterized protein n=1 Tax=Euplotes crassus TaxID=5936 RepID=A0AAD2D0I5_EUPCR|nr:unnamed protein product [Moneuplotes crassus]